MDKNCKCNAKDLWNFDLISDSCDFNWTNVILHGRRDIKSYLLPPLSSFTMRHKTQDFLLYPPPPKKIWGNLWTLPYPRWQPQTNFYCYLLVTYKIWLRYLQHFWVVVEIFCWHLGVIITTLRVTSRKKEELQNY